jgi:hypothetical protein
MPKSQQSWVRSQHPPRQWNLGAADEAVLNTVHRKKNQKSNCLFIGLADLHNLSGKARNTVKVHLATSLQYCMYNCTLWNKLSDQLLFSGSTLMPWPSLPSWRVLQTASVTNILFSLNRNLKISYKCKSKQFLSWIIWRISFYFPNQNILSIFTRTQRPVSIDYFKLSSLLKAFLNKNCCRSSPFHINPDTNSDP